MAHRRCLHALTRHATALASLKTLANPPPPPAAISFKTITQSTSTISSHFRPSWFAHHSFSRHFCSSKSEGDDKEDEDDEDESSDGEDIVDTVDTVPEFKREYSLEESAAEAEAIGYKVVGPLQKTDRVFKPYEPVFAVVQVVF